MIVAKVEAAADFLFLLVPSARRYQSSHYLIKGSTFSLVHIIILCEESLAWELHQSFWLAGIEHPFSAQVMTDLQCLDIISVSYIPLILYCSPFCSFKFFMGEFMHFLYIQFFSKSMYLPEKKGVAHFWNYCTFYSNLCRTKSLMLTLTLTSRVTIWKDYFATVVPQDIFCAKCGMGSKQIIVRLV